MILTLGLVGYASHVVGKFVRKLHPRSDTAASFASMLFFVSIATSGLSVVLASTWFSKAIQASLREANPYFVTIFQAASFASIAAYFLNVAFPSISGV